MTFPLTKFTDIVQDKSGGNKKLPQELFLVDGQYPVVDQGKKFIAGYINDENYLVKSTDLPVVIFGDHTKAIKFVDFPFAMGADGVKVLKPKDECDTKYLYHYLRYAKIPDAGYSRHYKFLKELEIPLPPLTEQRRIASILDQADELRQKRQQAIEKLDQLLQATFIDMFGDPVSNPKGWEVLKWGDALKIINGKNQKAVLDQNGTFPICGSGGVMGYANEWLTPAQSVIIGRKGNINKPILMFENFWNVDTAFGLVPNKDLLKVDYLFWFCHFFNFEQLNKTVTIPSLTKSDLLNIKIPIPPLEKQLYFSNICDQTRKLKSKMELKDLNLFSSLQNQAFSGTL